MASPILPNTGQPVNFQTNVNRAKTQRWVEAKPGSYDGNDWGDGEEDEDKYDDRPPQPAPYRAPYGQPQTHPQNQSQNQANPGQRYGELSYRHPSQPGNRSATNPAQMQSRNRPSFEQGEERRAFSTNVGGFEGPYPSAQRAPFPQADQFSQGQNHDSREGPVRNPPPISTNQQGRRPSMEQEPFPRAPYVPEYRSGPYSAGPRTGPYPGQLSQTGRRSQSSGRPSHADLYGGRDSPIRATPSPISAVSQTSREEGSAKAFPPRKSSLSQQSGPVDHRQPSSAIDPDREPKPTPQSAAESKPLPFIRPADIYKRMAEEKEKESRASEESSRRPSIDDQDLQQRLKSPPNPVAERHGEPATGNPIDAGSTSSFVPPNVYAHRSTVEQPHQQPTQEPIQRHYSVLRGQDPPQTLHNRDFPPNFALDRGGQVGSGQAAESTEELLQDSSALRHNPSAGFTSVVHQAFDDSQDKVPPTPTSTSGNSIVRSNSASASDISPIIEKDAEDPGRRPLSSTTITMQNPNVMHAEDSDPLPPPIRPGFRRDSRTPSPGNSPARRPLSVSAPDVPGEEIELVSATTPTQAKPMSNITATVPRSESPTKGTVRDLAGKFENRSSTSSPVGELPLSTDTIRPANERGESFRPALPGGWISYSTSPGATSPVQESTPLQSTENLPRGSPAISETEIPTAGPPRPREPVYEASGKAFEALSAAGSALSGAFGAVTGFQRDDSSENDPYSEPSTRDATPAQERPGGLSPVQEVLSVASSAPPTPPVKDGPFQQNRSQLGYFPSPLRPSRPNENPAPMRPQMLPALSTDNSPQDTESDRLRKEIVRSLTPKSVKGGSQLRFEEEQQAAPLPGLPTASLPHESVRERTSTHSDEDYHRFRDDSPDKATPGVHVQPEPVQADAPYHTSDPAQGVEQPTESYSGTSSHPLLQKRFSWEASTENMGTLSEAITDESSPARAAESVHSTSTIGQAGETVAPTEALPSKQSDDRVPGTIYGGRTDVPATKSNQSLQGDSPPSPLEKTADGGRRSLDSDVHDGASVSTQSCPGSAGQPDSAPVASKQSQGSPVSPFPSPSPSPAAFRDVSFREILGMQTPQERIRAYNGTRQHLATQESGLLNWIQTTGAQYPEHHELLNRNGRLMGPHADAISSHRPSPSRSKFPRLGASVGGPSQQGHSEPNDPSKATYGSPSSGRLTSQQVQGEGKKLLQSAGKFGGKAGGAAKGLFAKGKNKFRTSSSGADKAPSSSSQRDSQPRIHVEGVPLPHSSGAAAIAAPQLSPILSASKSNDTWSLSYAASEHASRTPTVGRGGVADGQGYQEPRYANLGPPDYGAESAEARNTVKSSLAPSPQISALGSTHQDDIPSRSISEVTRPDEGRGDDPPSRPQSGQDGGRRQDVAALEANGDEACREDGVRGPSTQPPFQPDSTPSHVLVTKANMTDGNGSIPLLRSPLDEPINTASSGSNYSQPSPGTTLPNKTQGTRLEDDRPRDGSLGTGLGPRQSIVSAVSSPSPEPAAAADDDHGGLSPPIRQQSVSPAQHGTDVANPVREVSPPDTVRQHEDATPPYTAITNSKAAEAAAEKLLEASSPDRRQSLPAYQSPIGERPPTFPFQPSAIVPVADLSARNRGESGQAPNRPFSFVNTNDEDVLHRHQPSKNSQSTASSSLAKELGLDMNKSGGHQYTRPPTAPSNDADIAHHPAFRASPEQPLPSQNRNFTPPQRPLNQSAASSTQAPTEQQYRIPGPYGQQFRSLKPVSTASNVMQPPQQRPPHSAPARQSEHVLQHPAMGHQRQRSSENPSALRLPHTEHSLPDGETVVPPEPSPPTPRSRFVAAGLFRPRSQSKPGPAAVEDRAEVHESQLKEDRNRERGGSFFRPHSRQDNESVSTQFGSTKGNASRSHSALSFYHITPHPQAPESMPNGMKAKGKEQKAGKILKRAPPTSHDADASDGKKKGTFGRLSGLFSKSVKGNPPPKVQAVQRAASLQPMQHQHAAVTPVPTSSMAKQAQQNEWRSADQVPPYEDRRAQQFRGQAPPVGGYYAPAGQPPDPAEFKPRATPWNPNSMQPAGFQQQAASPPTRDTEAFRPVDSKPLPQPREPESFIGGRRLSEQRAAEQAQLLSQLSAPTRQQHPAHTTLRPPPPASWQVSSKPPPRLGPPVKISSQHQPPHSAPPSAQHFPPTPAPQQQQQREQQQQQQQSSPPRSVSQRFPPDLRIDTSGRINPNRRSQPLPAVPPLTTQADPLPTRSQNAAPPPLPDNHTNAHALVTKPKAKPEPIATIPAYSSGANAQRTSPYTAPSHRLSQHSPYGYGTARGLRKDALSHAIDLHKRSRSPRNGRRESFDGKDEPAINEQDPASKLGTFSEVGRYRSRSRQGEGGVGNEGGGGEVGHGGVEDGEDGEGTAGGSSYGQEKPWKIDLPVGDEDASSTLSPKKRTAAENVMGVGAAAAATAAEGVGHNRVPLGKVDGNTTSNRVGDGGSGAGTNGVHGEEEGGVMEARGGAVELPGSKAPGEEDSDEEIIMSSTAYPGQEWIPEMRYGHWDD